MFAKIRHVALYSENYERMSTFYQKAFGMKKITNGSTNPDRGHISDGWSDMTKKIAGSLEVFSWRWKFHSGTTKESPCSHS